MNLKHRQHTSPASSRFVPRAWLLSFGLIGVAAAQPAWAATEGCDLECPLGTTCELAPGSCPAIGCVDPADCPPCDAQPTPYCAPAECESDSDCGDSMRCAEHSTLDCGPATSTPAAAPAAADGDEPRAAAPEAAACEPSVIRQCAPRWQLPCTADADCGDGFRCEETEACSVPPYDPSAGTPPSSEVTCTLTGTFACVVVVTSCEADADCPDTFTCVDDPNGTCSSSSDGQTQCEERGRVCAPRVVASPAATSGDVATASSNESGPGDDVGKLESSASQGSCALNGPTPGNALGLLSTLGLGAAFALRRRQPTR